MSSDGQSKIHPVQFEDVPAGAQARKGEPWIDKKIELIRDVKVRVTALLGSGELSVERLFSLKEGDAVGLDRDVTAPIDIVLEGKVIARGQIVVVDDKFGVQITEIVPPAK